MVHYHSIIWIDHHKAVVWNFNDDAQTKSIVKSRDQHQRIHVRKFANEGRHETPEELQFFRDVSQTLNGVEEIIVIGPAHAKDEFAAFLKKKLPQIGAKVVAVETSDHPTDAQLLAYARKHFKVLDRMI
jgi:stalled ribosome rescue protein Dom34